MRNRTWHEWLELSIYAVIGVLIIAGIVWFVTSYKPPPYQPPQPPAMGAPELDIVRWCEPLARERKSRSTLVPVKVGKVTMMQTRISHYYVDDPVKFNECMSGYGYSIEEVSHESE